MQGDSSAEWGKWRSLFWPVHRKELKKLLPMTLIFFLIAFNYNALRAYKDTIVVTASHSGAEIIPFIKVWAVLPGAIGLTFLFTRIANRYGREQTFYIMISLFAAFFLLFAFVLYPARETLHPERFADWLQHVLPLGCKGLIAILRNWTFSLFYVMAELWSTAIFSVLFWGFANEVTNVSEAKRYYGILVTGGNVAGIFSGQMAVIYSQNAFFPWIPYGKTPWDQSLLFLCCTLFATCGLIMAIFRWLNRNGLESLDVKKEPKEKIQMSMRKNFAYLLRSRYLLYMALIVLLYNVAVNLVEVVWKDQMKQLYPSPGDYNVYMSRVMMSMSLIASVVGFFTTTSLIRRSSWTASAMIPVAVVGGTGILFLAVAVGGQTGLLSMPAILGMSPLLLGVTLGSLQNCLTRAAKYTFFDATKEIAFIPLSEASKLKGKAAIDGVGSRIGKSGSSVLYQVLLILFSTVGATTPYVAILFSVAILLWAVAVVRLGREFDTLTGVARKPLSVYTPEG